MRFLNGIKRNRRFHYTVDSLYSMQVTDDNKYMYFLIEAMTVNCSIYMFIKTNVTKSRMSQTRSEYVDNFSDLVPLEVAK